MAEPLTEAERAALHTLLVEARDRTVATLASEDRAGVVELDQSTVGRLSRMDAMQQQAMAAAERRRLEARLPQLDRALARFADGDYGDCARCGEPIAIERLRVRPESPFCVPCATRLGA